MSWLFSRALVAEYSAATYLDGGLSAASRLIPSRHPFSRNGKTTGSFCHSLFGLTCEVSTVAHGVELLTWFREDSLAKKFPPQERNWELKVSAAGFGGRWRESFATFDPATSSWRTPQLSLFEVSEPYSQTWPNWGWMRNGVCFEHPTWEQLTNARVSGLWPTPYGFQAGNGPDGNEYSTFVREWAASHIAPAIHLGAASAAELCLSPAFVEMQMGWPSGWTDSGRLQTDRFQRWLGLHGEPS